MKAHEPVDLVESSQGQRKNEKKKSPTNRNNNTLADEVNCIKRGNSAMSW